VRRGKDPRTLIRLDLPPRADPVADDRAQDRPQCRDPNQISEIAEFLRRQHATEHNDHRAKRHNSGQHERLAKGEQPDNPINPLVERAE